MTKAATNPTGMPPHQQTIRECLNRIRRRLFVVRTTERVVVALIVAGLIGAAFVLARYLRARYPAWSLVAASSPAILVAMYWAARARWWWVSRAASPLCVRLLSILTLLTVAAGVTVFAGSTWMQLPVWAFAATPFAVFSIVAIAAGRQVSPQAAAIFVDRQAGLEERVSTAYELLNRSSTSPEEARFQAPLVASAVDACKQVRSAKVGYARLDRRVYLAAAVCAAAAFGATFLQPLMATPSRGGPRAVDPTMAVTIKDLQKTLDKLAKEHSRDVSKDPALKPLEKTIQELQASDGSKLDKLAAINRGRSDLKNQLDRYAGTNKAEKALNNSKELAELSKAMQQYERALQREARGEPGASAERAAAEKAVSDASKAIAEKLAGGQMGEKDRQAMADALGKAADAVKNDPQLKESLRQAEQAANAGDAAKLEQGLKQAASQMGSSAAEGAQNKDAMAQAKSALDDAAKEAGQSSGGESGGGNGQENGSGDQMASGDTGNGSGENEPGEGQQGDGQPGEGQAGAPGESGSVAAGGPGAGTEKGASTPGHTNADAPSDVGSNENPTGVGDVGVMKKRYTSKEIDSAGNKERAGGQLDKSARAKATAEFVGPADRGDNSIVGYDPKAMEAAEKRAAEVIRSGRVPPSYRDLVKKFYTTSKVEPKK